MTKTDQSELSKKILGVFARYGVIAEKPGAAKALVELFSQHAGSAGGEHAENLAEVANWVENQGCPEEANQLRAAAARIAELEGDPRLKLLYSVGCGPETICAMLREEDAKVMAGDISAASGMVMWVKNHAALYRRAGEVMDGK